MRYQKYPPAAELQRFVECYYVWEGEAPARMEVQSPPSSFGAVVFNYADPYQAFQNKRDVQAVPLAFVCGTFTSNYHLVLEGKIGMIGIVFKASAIHNFFDLRMSNLVNSRMPLSLLLGDEADRLWDEIKAGTTDEGRKNILERFVLSYLTHAKTRLTIIDEAVEFIDQKKGCVSVEAVAEHLRVSRRYLEKKFLEKVGVAPKFYARIKRFVGLSNIVAHSPSIDWQQLVHDYGFHDQSHLVKEFLEFNQMNPSNYHLLHREMTRFVKR